MRKEVTTWTCDRCADIAQDPRQPKGWVLLRAVAGYDADLCAKCAPLYLAFLKGGGTGTPNPK